MSLVQAVKRANAPGPPEHSIVFRTAATACVVISLLACWSQQEIPAWVTFGAITLVVIGNVFSFARRANPLGGVKIVLALSVVAAFAWFLRTVTLHATVGDLATVEGPLAVLFAWIQVGHAFDVPSRRDLGFSLAGSATLMAVAAAQAVSAGFGLFVVAWAAVGLVGLLAMWGSMAGGARFSPLTTAVAAAAVAVVGLGAVAVLPPPHASSTVVFPTAIAGDSELNQPGGLAGANGEPAAAAPVNGKTRVGGFLGFAGPLDTAARATLGNQVVMRVRADRPTFWIAETFDRWEGQTWSETATKGDVSQLNSGPPFFVPLPYGEPFQAEDSDLQTFYIAQNGPNLVFHAANAATVWFPAHKLYAYDDGTILSSTTMGAGTIYTVESQINVPTTEQLEHARQGRLPGTYLSGPETKRYLQLPHPYPRVKALAERITRHATTKVAKVLDLEAWIGRHTRYTLDIPALRPGQDSVDAFLFGSRRGYCEQISTALAVMLRSLGVPAREATGYVPGPFNPLTDLYEIQARDAHAWVQVWFPGYGWQSFDPTALVPLANPTPADALGHDLVGALHHVPLAPVIVVIGLAAVVLVERRRRRTSAAGWPGAVTASIERAARRSGLGLGLDEALVSVAARLDRAWAGHGPPGPSASTLAVAAERAGFGGHPVGRAEGRQLRRQGRALARRARTLRRRRRAAP